MSAWEPSVDDMQMMEVDGLTIYASNDGSWAIWKTIGGTTMRINSAGEDNDYGIDIESAKSLALAYAHKHLKR